MPFAPEYLHLVFPGVTFHAWLYGRASVDPMKLGSSVEDQLATGRSLCQRHNWAIDDEFKDTGISASRHGKKARDDFEELLDAIENSITPPGVMRIVVAYEASRYYRDLEAYVRLRNACHAANVLLCYNGQVYDLSRRDDRKATAMHAVDAEDEADSIRDRNLRTASLTAAAGRPHGRLPYGYVRDYEVVNGRPRCVRQYEHPVSGPYVLKSFQRIDSGHGLLSLVRWLNSEPEAARPDGAEWSPKLARSLLLNRAYLGERAHHGTYRAATWDPIKGLDTPQGRAMFNRVVAKLTDASRRTQRGTAVAHLMTYIALCGECGDHALLSANTSRSGRQDLGCVLKKDTTIREEWMNAFVEEAVIEWFCDKRKSRAALVPDDREAEGKVESAQRMINGYEEQLREARELAESFDLKTGRPKLSAASLASMEQKLEPKLDAERKKLQELTGVSPLLLALLNASDPDVVWNGRPETADEPAAPGLALEQKREVIRKVVTVRLHKARTRGVRKLEPGRITLAFVGEPGFRARPLRAPASVPAEAPRRGSASGTG